MAEFRKIPVAALEPPDHLMREVTRSEKYESIRDSMARIGLINPITVREYEPGKYKIIAGMHRSTAATELGWELIDAKVLQPGEQDSDVIMASENLHKVDLNAMDEAAMYLRLQQEQGLTPGGIHALYNVPESRVRNLLAVMAGDPRCHQHIFEGNMSIAQALEISQFESEAYKVLAIKYAVENDMSAVRLAMWRKDVQRQGLEIGVDEAIAGGEAPKMIEITEPHITCTLLNHTVKLVGTKQYTVCPDCWNTYVQGLEALQREEELKNAGLYELYVQWRRAKLAEIQS